MFGLLHGRIGRVLVQIAQIKCRNHEFARLVLVLCRFLIRARQGAALFRTLLVRGDEFIIKRRFELGLNHIAAPRCFHAQLDMLLFASQRATSKREQLFAKLNIVRPQISRDDFGYFLVY